MFFYPPGLCNMVAMPWAKVGRVAAAKKSLVAEIKAAKLDGRTIFLHIHFQNDFVICSLVRLTVERVFRHRSGRAGSMGICCRNILSMRIVGQNRKSTHG